MSDMSHLVIFDSTSPGWLRIEDGRIVARGTDLIAIDPEAPEDETKDERVTLVVPGSDVALHWIDLPDTLAPAQAHGAARLLAGEVTIQPLDAVHVATAAVVDGAERRIMALVEAGRMADWLAACQALGYDPDCVIPEPLLIDAPVQGVRTFDRAGLRNARGAERAFAAEPDLAELLLADEGSLETLDRETFEAGIAAAVAAPAIDLRQGDFAKRRRWTVDWSHIRRLALIGAGILAATLLIQLVLLIRYSFATDALEREAADRARDALPGVTEVVDPAEQLRERLVSVGGGPDFSAMAAAVFGAVRDTEGAEIQSLVYANDGTLRISVAVPSPAETGVFQQGLAAAGLTVTPGATQAAGSRQIAEFTVSAS